jgi:hypothetical protein
VAAIAMIGYWLGFSVDPLVRLSLLMVLPETLHVKFRPRSGG